MTRRLTIDDASCFEVGAANGGVVIVNRIYDGTWECEWDHDSELPPTVPWNGIVIDELGSHPTPQAALDAAIAAGAVIDEGDET